MLCLSRTPRDPGTDRSCPAVCTLTPTAGAVPRPRPTSQTQPPVASHTAWMGRPLSLRDPDLTPPPPAPGGAPPPRQGAPHRGAGPTPLRQGSTPQMCGHIPHISEGCWTSEQVGSIPRSSAARPHSPRRRGWAQAAGGQEESPLREGRAPAPGSGSLLSPASGVAGAATVPGALRDTLGSEIPTCWLGSQLHTTSTPGGPARERTERHTPPPESSERSGTRSSNKGPTRGGDALRRGGHGSPRSGLI